MEFNVRLEFKLQPSETSDVDLLDALASFHPAVGPTDDGNTDVWITVQAANARQAVDVGLALASQASNAELLGFEVITTAEYDRRVGLTPVPELISSEEAAAMLKVSRQAVLKNSKLRQVRVGDRGIAFVRAEVEAEGVRKGTIEPLNEALGNPDLRS